MSTNTEKKSGLAIANSRVVQLWFNVFPDGQEIAQFLGVMIERIYQDTNEIEILPAWIPFEGQDNKDWKRGSTREWPIQGDQWKDLFAKPGRKMRYRITAMVGTPGNLTAREDLAVMTNAVELTSQHGAITLGVNDAILSTQSLARKLGTGPDGKPDAEKLIRLINTVGDPLREKLAGDILPMVRAFFLRALSIKGHLFGALYEDADPELVELQLKNKDLLDLILGNTGKDDETNKATRARFHAAKMRVHDRMLADGHLPHNKFWVLVDANGKPVAVLTGSTNWTATGLCGQTNVMVIIDDPEVAQLFYDYWQRLLKEGSEQSEAFRLANAKIAAPIIQSDRSIIRVCFSPCTKEVVKPQHNAATPPGLQIVFDLMDGTEGMLLGHLFFPGFPSVVSKMATMLKTRKDLLIRAVVNSPQALPRELGQASQGGEQLQPGVVMFHPGSQEPDIIAATALDKDLGPEIPELLKAGENAHAITHAKLLVGNPLHPTKCWCVFGSDQLGFKAEYQNDENLVIVVGNQSLCLALATFILDVYGHYRMRWMIRNHQSKFNGFLSSNPDWQKKYVQDGPARRELLYWLGQLAK